jgi:putative hydrolase of the HAD superfamily
MSRGASSLAEQNPSGRPDQRNKVVIFDGDDTLWITEPLYDQARTSAAQVVAASGVDPVLWDQLERVIDVENVQRFGLSAERFPTSCVEAYESAAEQMGLIPKPEVMRAVQSAAGSVFRETAPLAIGAVDLLESLHERYRLILYTQGDPDIQKKRITDSGLYAFFDFILVVETKSSGDLSQLIQKLNRPPSDFVFVGNSVRSDINPAISVGMNAVWVDRHVWDYEQQLIQHGSGRLYEIENLQQAATVIETALA